MATGLIFTVDWSGTPSVDDIVTAKFLIDKYNEENGTSLGYASGAELKTSAQVILDARDNRLWNQAIAHSTKEILDSQNASKLSDLRVAIANRLQGGETIDDILSDLES